MQETNHQRRDASLW